MLRIFFLISTLLILPLTVFSQDEIEVTIEGNLPDSLQEKYKMVINNIANPDHYLNLILSDFTIKEPKDMPFDEVNEKVHQVINLSMGRFHEHGSEMTSDIYNIYIENFSKEELEELTQFFNTDLGKKLKEADALAIRRMLRAKNRFESIKEETYIEVFESDGEEESSSSKKSKKKTRK